MDQAELVTLLDQLISNWESEVMEFKRGKDGFSSSELGKYVSALANEANLRGHERGWLVFGVEDKTRVGVGSSYKENPAHLQADKKSILDGTGSRVILFEIPAAPRGMPINWNGHYYGRAGENLVALGPDKLDEIRA